MKKILSPFLACVLVVSLAKVSLTGSLSQDSGGKAPPETTAPLRFTRTVAKGVELVQEVWPDGSPDGPMAATTLVIDPKQKGIRLEAALGQDRVWGTDPTFGREVISKLAARHGAAAAINAGFFPFAGNPIGLHIQDGELVTEPGYNRTCLLLTRKGKATFAALGFSATVKAVKGKENYSLAGLNRRPAAPDKAGKLADELLLFTPIFFDNTLKSAGRVEVVLSGVSGPFTAGKTFTGTVERVTEGGGTPLSKGTVVLSGSGKGADFLRTAATPGAKLSLRLDLTKMDGKPFDAHEIAYAVGGGPRLVTDGKPDIPLKAEGMSPTFSTTRHPRTAVGITRDGKILLVTVDGRQKGVSRGMSLPELAALLIRLGATEAANLDGGGSSVCVVRNQIVNAPSDGLERPVANMLVVLAPQDKDMSKANPSGEVSSVAPLLVGESRNLAGEGGAAGEMLWGMKPGGVIPGFIRQDGTFTAVRPGKATIYARPRSGKGAAQAYRVEVQ